MKNYGDRIDAIAERGYVAIDYQCRPCSVQEEPVVTRFFRDCISTSVGTFELEYRWWASGDRVEVQDITTHTRAVMKCPRCGHTPAVRGERFDAALRKVYEPGRRAVIPYRL